MRPEDYTTWEAFFQKKKVNGITSLGRKGDHLFKVGKEVTTKLAS